MRKYITLLLILLLLYLVYSIFIKLQKYDETVDPAVFARAVSSSDKLFIIQDLRGSSNNDIRRNILQCGVDFASSIKLVGKNLTIFAFENNTCTSIDGFRSVKECENDVGSSPYIFIKEGQEGNNLFYKNKLVVNIGKNYTINSCSVR